MRLLPRRTASAIEPQAPDRQTKAVIVLRIIVLGSGAGGGFPQWNCNCSNCRRARAGDLAAPPSTQSSLAVSADDGESWFLLNASPDLRQQIAQSPRLHPRIGLRHSPIVGVTLTNADVDHVAGLLTMRESQPFAIHGTSRVLEEVKANAIFNILDRRLVSWRPLPLDRAVQLPGRDGAPSALTVEAFPVPGKVALWLEDPRLANLGSIAEDTIGLMISSTVGQRVFYIPGCAALPAGLADRLRGADAVFFDGTTYTDDEMPALGLGTKTASRMGHMSMSGPDGAIAAFAPLGVRRRIFVHINNSNPVLLADSAERATVEAAGWDIARDGMELEL